MRLVTFRHAATGDRDRVGALIEGDDAVVDLGLSPGGPAFASMLALIRAGDEALAEARRAAANPRAGAVVPVAEIALRTPLPEPPQIRDCLCFEEHLKRAFEVLRKSRDDSSPDAFRIPEIWYRQPIYYKANRLAVVGHGADVVWPGYAEVMDYELEFGFSSARAAGISRVTRRAPMSSAIRSSTIFRRGMPRRAKCRAGSDPARARISTAATSSDHAS